MSKTFKTKCKLSQTGNTVMTGYDLQVARQ